MDEESIRKHLNQKIKSGPSLPSVRVVPRRTPKQSQVDTFKDFSASHLLCPRCRRANPVREKLLLYLPDGNLFDYQCTVCGTSCGSRKG